MTKNPQDHGQIDDLINSFHDSISIYYSGQYTKQEMQNIIAALQTTLVYFIVVLYEGYPQAALATQEVINKHAMLRIAELTTNESKELQ